MSVSLLCQMPKLAYAVSAMPGGSVDGRDSFNAGANDKAILAPMKHVSHGAMTFRILARLRRLFQSP